MATAVDSRLANRILLGLLLGAVAGALTLLAGAASPTVLEAARSSTARPKAGWWRSTATPRAS